MLRIEQPLALHAGVVMHALRTIRAILRAAARLDGQQCGNLYFVRRKMPAMDGLRLEDQVGKGQGEQSRELLASPIVADVVHW